MSTWNRGFRNCKKYSSRAFTLSSPTRTIRAKMGDFENPRRPKYQKEKPRHKLEQKKSRQSSVLTCKNVSNVRYSYHIWFLCSNCSIQFIVKIPKWMLGICFHTEFAFTLALPPSRLHDSSHSRTTYLAYTHLHHFAQCPTWWGYDGPTGFMINSAALWQDSRLHDNDHKPPRVLYSYPWRINLDTAKPSPTHSFGSSYARFYALERC